MQYNAIADNREDNEDKLNVALKGIPKDMARHGMTWHDKPTAKTTALLLLLNMFPSQHLETYLN